MMIDMNKTIVLDSVVSGLKKSLALELGSVQMYLNYGASLTGILRISLQDTFYEEIDDELNHAKYLSEKIVVLGGDCNVSAASYRKVNNPYEMIMEIMNAETLAINEYESRIDEANKLGDIGLRVKLEEILAEETYHKENMQLILRNYSDFLKIG